MWWDPPDKFHFEANLSMNPNQTELYPNDLNNRHWKIQEVFRLN